MFNLHSAGSMPSSAYIDETLWRDGSGRDWKPRELEKSHLANIIYHMTEYSGKYSKVTFGAMLEEALRRGMTDEYLANAPYPYIDERTGVKMIADYSTGLMKLKPYEGIRRFILKVGSSVQGITLDPTVFGDPVWKSDLPKTTKEVRYDVNDIIPWSHDVAAAIMTYWLQFSGDPGSVCVEWRKKNYVLLKVFQKNKFGITHLIVQDADLVFFDPDEA